MDFKALEFIKSFDLDGFLNFVKKVNPTICGYGGIATLISMLDKTHKVMVFDYYSSKDIINYPSLDFVTYFSLGFLK